jgi:hypothetical protein
VNGRNQPFIAYVDCSVWCQTSWGPCFGACEIKIASDSNINTTSSSSLGYNYKHQDYPCRTDEAKTILAGSHTFQTAEIEVFFIN